MPETFTQSMAGRLIDACERSSNESTQQWLVDARVRSSESFDENRFLAAYSGAARRLRSVDCSIDPSTVEELENHGVRGAGSWPAARVARTGFLLGALSNEDSDAAVSTAWKVFRTGDNEERIALLGSLPLTDKPQAYLELAIDACRTHVTEVFEAVACDNAYPARFFPDPNFNQMILKAVFIEVSLDRVVGLGERLNVELSRMAEDFAKERTAAGRSVPADLSLLMTATG